MFQDADLENAMLTQHTLGISSLVMAEFNLNDLENISKIGNYKYRNILSVPDKIELYPTYDPQDLDDAYSDSLLSYEEYKQTEDPNPFVVEDKNPSFFYSLGDCFLPFRPRSGINKARFISNKYLDNVRSGNRPRYYMSSKSDYFKYWSSYRKDGVKERGISFPMERTTGGGGYEIHDAAPFVVYSTPIAVNRIVVKMQTNVGSVDLGVIRTQNGQYVSDPLFNYANATVPKHWKIQILDDENNWITVADFNHESLRSDNGPIVPKDGNVELFYGIVIPSQYIDNFNFLGYIEETLLPPADNLIGQAYIHGASTTQKGTMVVWDGTDWTEEVLDYGWSLLEDVHIKKNGNCEQIVNPLYYINDGIRIYREMQKINGLRVAVETMNSPESCFDLIELSPRLSTNITSYTSSFDFTKTIADSDSGLPVGSLTASNGSISLSNMDNAFNESNTFDWNTGTGSIISSHLNKNIKFILYEEILNINGYNKYIPLKTLYSDRFTTAVSGMDDISIPLRDLYFRLETSNAPSVLSKDTRLTYAVAQVLDYIGFSNFIFKTDLNSDEPVLPYFFIEKGVSVAEILQRIAIATQSAMFFDEYNNFVVMTKEYMLANSDVRPTDMILSGNDTPLANVESIVPNESIVLNNGIINYTVRYIQREISSIGSSIQLDNERTYRYKPTLLWEVSSNQETKTINESTKEASGFALGAIALNSDLSDEIPVVENHAIVNNIIDVGESIYWLPRFQGYLYANGEIIRFDAVEYAIPGSSSPLVWITNNQQYQQYFSKLSFNGKIYPTGRIRIYAEPYYEIIDNVTYFKNGAVKNNGRAQFGTQIAYHPAGLPEYWSTDSNAYGIKMNSSNLFTTIPTEDLIAPALGSAKTITPEENALARKSSRNGIMKNFMSSKVYEDGYVNKLKTTNSGTLQSSALIFRGPRPNSTIPNHRDFISMVHKDLSGNAAFKHFGTRMRIIGKSDQNFGQVSNGSSNYYSITAQDPQDSTSINGGSGGIGIFVDKETGSGYFLEIIALSDSNIDKYIGLTDANQKDISVHNVIFYKINPNSSASGGTASVPQKLWGGLTEIIVDSGIFAGQDRLAVAETNSVYDLSIEYQKMNDGSINFYLFMNNILIKAVKDNNPLPVKTSAALFVRASSECMFENFYALEDLTVRNESSALVSTENIFDQTSITTNEFMKKYAISGMVQSTYLTSISSSNPLKMKIYYEEFGTIMREAVHFTIEYDKAYPAFFSKIAKTFSSDKSFTVSGYYGGPYEAEFIVFNSADKAIVLDDSTGSYLRILGVTFTQNSIEKLSVDDYYNKLSDFSNPQFENNYLISPEIALNDFNKIKASRSKYGNREFMLDSMYIQSQDQARELMKWLINKTLKPRKSLNVNMFAMPHLQLGDIVSIEYLTPDDINFIDPSKRFVVQEISYSRGTDSISQQLKVVEI